MKKLLYLLLCGCVVAAGTYSITAQNKKDKEKIQAEKVSVKKTDDGIKIQEKEVTLSMHQALLGKWSLLGFVADGIPPRNFMGGEQFPKGTVFTFGKDGKGIASYQGKRISNFQWHTDGSSLKIKYVVKNPSTNQTSTEKDRFRILELTAEDLVIGTAWEQELVGRLRQQREVQKLKMDFSTHMILAFQRN